MAGHPVRAVLRQQRRIRGTAGNPVPALIGAARVEVAAGRRVDQAGRAAQDRVQPVEYIAEAVFRLASGDVKTLTGRIDHAAPFLKEFSIQPAELV